MGRAPLKETPMAAGNATIGSLRVELGLDTAQFQAGLKKSQAGLAGFAKSAAGIVGASARSI